MAGREFVVQHGFVSPSKRLSGILLPHHRLTGPLRPGTAIVHGWRHHWPSRPGFEEFGPGPHPRPVSRTMIGYSPALNWFSFTVSRERRVPVSNFASESTFPAQSNNVIGMR